MNLPRIGLGYDVHKLSDGESLILGGVKIDYKKGTVAHSDGDVVCHAIADALLGAANLRDIGHHFPDNNDKYKNISSIDLLKNVIKLIETKSYIIGNIDATISLEKPKLSTYIPKMQEKIANTIKIPVESVSIKATTTEKLGFIGKEEGIAVQAIAMIFKKEN